MALDLAKTVGAPDAVFALCGVARALTEQGEVARALKVVDEHLKDKWQDRALLHKDQWTDLALHYIAIAQAERGEAEAALRITLRIKRPQAQGEAFREAALAQLRAGDTKGALRTGKGIEDTGNRLPVIVEVARTQAKKDRTGAVKLLREALAEAKRMQDPPHVRHARAEALRRIASAQAEIASVVEALAWARRVESPHDRVAALRGVAEGGARRNDLLGGGSPAPGK